MTTTDLPGEWRIKRPNTTRRAAADPVYMLDGAAHFFAAQSPEAALCGVARTSSRSLLTGERLRPHYRCSGCSKVMQGMAATAVGARAE